MEHPASCWQNRDLCMKVCMKVMIRRTIIGYDACVTHACTPRRGRLIAIGLEVVVQFRPLRLAHLLDHFGYSGHTRRVHLALKSVLREKALLEAVSKASQLLLTAFVQHV